MKSASMNHYDEFEVKLALTCMANVLVLFDLSDKFVQTRAPHVPYKYGQRRVPLDGESVECSECR